LAIGYWLLAVVYCLCTPAVLAAGRPAPVHAVARTAVPAAALPVPVQAVARTAVLALALGSPVQAVARTTVLALALGSPVRAVARTAVLAPALPTPGHGRSSEAHHHHRSKPQCAVSCYLQGKFVLALVCGVISEPLIMPPPTPPTHYLVRATVNGSSQQPTANSQLPIGSSQ
jgi:hypothetical protein